MNIIREGDLERAKKKINRTVTFQCGNCLCIFTANYNEYKDCTTQREGSMYSCECPCCKTTVYSDKRDVY